jgi:hypothetical protein
LKKKIEVYAKTPEDEAYFRGQFLGKAEQYFPRLTEWCPPIYLGVEPPGGLIATYHHIPTDASYIYVQSTDLFPGRDDFNAQADYIYHELAHVFEYKFIGRRAGQFDERFAQAVHDSVRSGNKLLYVVLTQMMGEEL